MKTPAALITLAASVAATGVHNVAVMGVSAHSEHAQLRSKKKVRGSGAAEGFVKALAFKFKLRVCNAYPSESKLGVGIGAKEDLTNDGALPYKACKDFTPELKSGDKVDFKLDGTEVGTFTITDLPQNDATLLLIVHRRDTTSTTVSFESHVFASLMNAQIAVIDAYTGSAKSTVKIQDFKESAELGARQEELRYSSVVAVNPGDYECVLYGEDSAEKARARLTAVAGECYLVMRTGVDDKTKPRPQELIAFPQSESTKSAASVHSVFGSASLTLLALVVFKQ